MSPLEETEHLEHLEMRTTQKCVRSLRVEHDIGKSRARTVNRGEFAHMSQW